MLRPRIRLSIAAALGIVLAAYVLRGMVLRGGDLRPDLPLDLIAIAIVVAGVALAAWMRTRVRADDQRDESVPEEESVRDLPPE